MEAATFLLNIFGVIYWLFILFSAISVICGIIFFTFRFASKRHIKKPRNRYVIIPFISMLIAVAAFALNMGWYRVILIIFGIAPIHALLFLFTSLYSADFASENTKLRIYTIISHITYPLCYILLPDGGDYGGEYMFFWLIKNEQIISVAYFSVLPCFIISILSIVLQFFKARKLKKLACASEETKPD